jgi:hypothetical protein
MRKQFLKGFAMLVGIITVAMVTAVASANGQSMPTKANIPFEFVVGNRSLPAGAYTIRSVSSTGEALRVVNGRNSKDSAARLTVEASGKSQQAKLVFHRYGDRYFLAEVWSSPEDGRQLLPSKEERAIRKERSRLAANTPAQPGFETVEIALALQ